MPACHRAPYGPLDGQALNEAMKHARSTSEPPPRSDQRGGEDRTAQRSASKAWQAEERFRSGLFHRSLITRTEVPMIHRMKIKAHERGLLFREGEVVTILRPGVHWYFDPLLKLGLQIVSPREP